MKLYHFVSPQNFSYAQATRRGTWYPQTTTICPECKTSRQKRVSPLMVEWEPGSDQIGDFVWAGLVTDLIVVDRVKAVFESQFSAIEFGPVEFFQSSRLKKPIKSNSKTKPRVWLPYSGPLLWDVLPTHWCHLDHARSGVSVAHECLTCKKTIYSTPPWSQRNLVLDTATWNGEDIFHICEYSGGIFCTEQVKVFIEDAGFTNVSFLEDGVIPI